MTTPSPSVNPYSSPEPPAATSNSLVRASLVIAIVLAVISVVMNVINGFIPMVMYGLGLDAAGIGLFYTSIAVLNLLLGAAGLVLGIVGCRRGGKVVQAGIGIGVCGFVAISALISLLATPLVGLLY